VSLTEAKQMAAERDRRTGLRRADIDVVFVTHEHGEHRCGLRPFLPAR
jgi:hypothetical protein